MGNIWNQLKNDAPKGEKIIVRTKTGNYTHYADPKSSITTCGKWLKTQAINMRIEGMEAATCENCLRLGSRYSNWELTK